jgi:hypothetical protein
MLTVIVGEAGVMEPENPLNGGQVIDGSVRRRTGFILKFSGVQSSRETASQASRTPVLSVPRDAQLVRRSLHG